MKNERQMSGFKIMGICNLTPDSFSDGGLFLPPEKAIEHCQKLLDDGADILDLGAESTRPGALAISGDEQWQRLKPVLQGLQKKNIKAPISIDTRQASVMLKALDEGASIFNNVAGVCRKEELLALKKHAGLKKYIAMHMHLTPETMQSKPLQAQEAIARVGDFLAESEKTLMELGFAQDAIILDPGIGFGKSLAANLMLMSQSVAWSKDYTLMLGVSRKSWLASAFGLQELSEREAPSKVCEIILGLLGVKYIRTHDALPLSRLRELVRTETLGAF